MKFSTKISSLQNRDWAEYYLDYNKLKWILAEREIPSSTDTALTNGITTTPPVSLLTKRSFRNESVVTSQFLAELYQQLQTIAMFELKQEGLVASNLQECRIELQQLLEKCHAEAAIGIPDEEEAIVDKDPTTKFRPLREKYNRIGANLLQLVQYVDINTKGILRLLKKHDKRVDPHKSVHEVFVFGKSRNGLRHCPYASAPLMTSLQNHETLDALCVTLQDGYTLMRHLQRQHLQDLGIVTEVPNRGRPVDKAQEATSQKRPRSPKGLGRRYRSSQGLAKMATDSIEDDEDDNADDDDDYDKQVMVNTLQNSASVASVRLAPHRSATALYDNDADNSNNTVGMPVHRAPSFALLAEAPIDGFLSQEDFVMAQIYAARRSIINQKSEVWTMLATTALAFPSDPSDDNSQDIQAEYERAAELEYYKRQSAISSRLNFVSSFIYMTNYLIVIPTVVSYSEKLGADPALSSAIVGMTPFATIFSTILYSWWTSYSYRVPLLVATLLNLVGNIVYAMGYPCNSMTMVLIGRLLSGMGSCRPINRRYIADAYSTAERTAASAHFVAVGCFGMSLGPFLGSVLHYFARHSTSPYWQVENAPGWFMAVVWFVYGIFHVVFFIDPPREDDAAPPATTTTKSSNEGESKPLLSKSIQAEEQEERRIPIWKNAPVMVNFFIYFIEKLLMECVSSSTSILTFYYFDWPGSWAGYWLAFLCILVLPVNLLVGYLSRIYEDREMMVVMQIATIVGCVVILRLGEEYYIEQYMLGTLIVVVTSNMVEGPNMSLLSKTIPKSWRKGFLNVGLLATEAATMGRTAGDAFLALCGTGGIENQLNWTFGSMILATTFTLWITYRFYDSLIPTEDKTL